MLKAACLCLFFILNISICFTYFNNIKLNNDNCDEAVEIPTDNVTSVYLGETQVNITVYQQLGQNGELSYNFINVHENENTSVVAAKALLYMKGGGSITFLQHGGGRNVTFVMDGVTYTIDPNRMFTWVGIKANLYPYNEDAAMQVFKFSKEVLRVYNFDGNRQVIALHNNSPSYSALDYLPGGVYANDAQAVNIGNYFGPDYARDFFYIVPGDEGTSIYDCLTKQGFSAVLQSNPNGTLTDDGSLSVYCALHNKPYINTEAAASGGIETDGKTGEGTRVINQLIMLDHLTTAIENYGN